MKQRILTNSRPVKQSFAFVVGNFLNTTSITNREPDSTTEESSPRVPNRANRNLVWSMTGTQTSLYKIHKFYKDRLWLSTNLVTKKFLYLYRKFFANTLDNSLRTDDNESVKSQKGNHDAN